MLRLRVQMIRGNGQRPVAYLFPSAANVIAFGIWFLERKEAMAKYRALARSCHAETRRKLPLVAFGLEDPQEAPSARRRKQQLLRIDVLY